MVSRLARARGGFTSSLQRVRPAVGASRGEDAPDASRMVVAHQLLRRAGVREPSGVHEAVRRSRGPRQFPWPSPHVQQNEGALSHLSQRRGLVANLLVAISISFSPELISFRHTSISLSVSRHVPLAARPSDSDARSRAPHRSWGALVLAGDRPPPIRPFWGRAARRVPTFV